MLPQPLNCEHRRSLNPMRDTSSANQASMPSTGSLAQDLPQDPLENTQPHETRSPPGPPANARHAFQWNGGIHAFCHKFQELSTAVMPGWSDTYHRIHLCRSLPNRSGHVLSAKFDFSLSLMRSMPFKAPALTTTPKQGNKEDAGNARENNGIRGQGYMARVAEVVVGGLAATTRLAMVWCVRMCLVVGNILPL